MACAETGQQQSPNDESPELKAFRQHRSRLAIGLESSISRLSLKCYAKELIVETTYDMQFDGEWTSQSKRTEALFRCILKKVKELEEQGKSEEAQKVIEKIGKIVGKETVLDNIATTIKKCKSAADLRKCLDLVVSGTTTEVHRIAEQAYSSFIIGNEDYKFVVMPHSSRDEMHTQYILTEIEKQIKFNKKTLDVFLNILKEIGAPVSHHADDIKKTLAGLK